MELAGCAGGALLAMLGCAIDLNWIGPRAGPAAIQIRKLKSEPAADLSAPKGLQATSGELRSVPLTWEPLLIGEVGGYLVERSPKREGPFDRLAVVPGPLKTTYVDLSTLPAILPAASDSEADVEASSAPDGTTWFYRTRAYSPEGLLAPVASWVVAATTAPPPDAPEDLRAYSRQPRRVPLNWRSAEDLTVEGYRLERSPTSRGPFELLAEISGRHETSYVDRGLGDLRVFYYRVSAVNSAGGVGAVSQSVRAVTKPEPLPPFGLRIVEQRLGINELAWDPNVEQDLVEYRLLRTRNSADSPEVVVTRGPEEHSARDDAVSAGERVWYSLVAVDRDGLESHSSKPIEIESENYGLTASMKPDGVHLEWNARVDEGFQGGHVTRIARVQQRHLGFARQSSFVDTDVKPGVTYRYRVVLEHADGTLAPRSSLLKISIPET